MIVDVGTGFYVQKSREDARVFYEGKVEALEGSLKELEKVIQGKGGSLGVIEDAIRQKVMQQQQQQQQAGQKEVAASG